MESKNCKLKMQFPAVGQSARNEQTTTTFTRDGHRAIDSTLLRHQLGLGHTMHDTPCMQIDSAFDQVRIIAHCHSLNGLKDLVCSIVLGCIRMLLFRHWVPLLPPSMQFAPNIILFVINVSHFNVNILATLDEKSRAHSYTIHRRTDGYGRIRCTSI